MTDYPSSSPWGPHGPQVDAHSVTPNPTPSTPYDVGQPSFGAPAAAPGYSGGGYSGGYSGGGIKVGGGFLSSLVFVGFFWAVWVCLYPITAIAGYAALVFSTPLLRGWFPPDPKFHILPVAGLLAISTSSVLIAVLNRLELRLAKFAAYRIPRHVVRLVLLSALAITVIQKGLGIPFVGDPWTNLKRILSVPENMAGMAVILVGMHFLLWKGDKARAFWHRRLAAIWLGPKSG